MKRIIITILIWITLLLASFFIWRSGLTYGRFEGLGLLGLFIIALISGATLVLPGPSLIVVFIAGTIYNPFLVGVVMGLGSGLGELTGYIAGLSGKEILPKTDIVLRITKWMHQNGILTIFLLAAIPVGLIDVGGIVAGATRIPVWKFLAPCIAGKIIRFSIGALLGYAGIKLIWSFFQIYLHFS
jgi:membrane protein YqaA with SNARE-associated domain